MAHRRRSGRPPTSTRDIRNDIYSRRSIYPIEDVIDHVNRLWPSNVDFCVLISHHGFGTGSARDPETRRILNYPSFARTGGRIRRFSKPDDARIERDAFSTSADAHRQARGYVEIIARPRSGSQLPGSINSLINDTLSLCVTYFAASDLSRDVLSRIASQFVGQFMGEYGRPGFDFLDICDFLSSRFNVTASHIHRDSNESPLSGHLIYCDSRRRLTAGIVQSRLFKNQIHKALNDKSALSGSAQIATGAMSRTYFRIAPIVEVYPTEAQPDIARSQATSAVVITSSKRIPTLCAEVCSALIDQLIKKNFSFERLQSLDLLQEKIKAFDVMALARTYTASRKKELLHTFSSICSESICRSSRAFSATIRIYNPFSRALDLIANKHRVRGEYDTSQSPSINISQWSGSANAFCFTRCANGDSVLVQDIHKIPARLVKAGLKKLLIVRKATRSEVCLPLYAGSLPVGTLNIESAIPFSKTDLIFFNSIAGAFGQYFRLVEQGVDSSWLAQIEFMHSVFHALARPSGLDGAAKLANPSDEVGIVLDKFRAMYNRRLQDGLRVDNKHVAWTEFVSELRDDPSLSELLGKRSSTGGRGHLGNVSKIILNSSKFILENLATNSKKFSGTSDEARIAPGEDIFGPSVMKRHPQLQISYKSAGLLVTRELLDQFGVIPVERPLVGGLVDSQLRWGLFLSGVHARLVGGLFYVDVPSEGSAKLQVCIRMPRDVSRH